MPRLVVTPPTHPDERHIWDLLGQLPGYVVSLTSPEPVYPPGLVSQPAVMERLRAKPYLSSTEAVSELLEEAINEIQTDINRLIAQAAYALGDYRGRQLGVRKRDLAKGPHKITQNMYVNHMPEVRLFVSKWFARQNRLANPGGPPTENLLHSALLTHHSWSAWAYLRTLVALYEDGVSRTFLIDNSTAIAGDEIGHDILVKLLRALVRASSEHDWLLAHEVAEPRCGSVKGESLGGLFETFLIQSQLGFSRSDISWIRLFDQSLGTDDYATFLVAASKDGRTNSRLRVLNDFLVSTFSRSLNSSSHSNGQPETDSLLEIVKYLACAYYEEEPSIGFLAYYRVLLDVQSSLNSMEVMCSVREGDHRDTSSCDTVITELAQDLDIVEGRLHLRRTRLPVRRGPIPTGQYL